MRQLSDLLKQRDRLTTELEKAKVNSPEATIAAQLADLDDQVQAAQAEERKRQAAAAVAEIDAAVKAAEAALVNLIKATYREIDELAPLAERVYQARQLAAKYPEATAHKAHMALGSLNGYQKMLTDWIRAHEYARPDLIERAGHTRRYW